MQTDSPPTPLAELLSSVKIRQQLNVNFSVRMEKVVCQNFTTLYELVFQQFHEMFRQQRVPFLL
jgi:hypothetical protein